MGLYNFQERFVEYIQDGSKCHTIRSIRKNFTKVGDTMHLYHGLRQLKPAIKLIQPFPSCTAKNTIFFLSDKTIYTTSDIINSNEMTKDEKLLRKVLMAFSHVKKLSDYEVKELAYNDGFRAGNGLTITETFLSCVQSMHPLPFIGHLDVWHNNPSQLTYLQ